MTSSNAVLCKIISSSSSSSLILKSKALQCYSSCSVACTDRLRLVLIAKWFCTCTGKSVVRWKDWGRSLRFLGNLRPEPIRGSLWSFVAPRLWRICAGTWRKVLAMDRLAASALIWCLLGRCLLLKMKSLARYVRVHALLNLVQKFSIRLLFTGFIDLLLRYIPPHFCLKCSEIWFCYRENTLSLTLVAAIVLLYCLARVGLWCSNVIFEILFSFLSFFPVDSFVLKLCLMHR